MVTLQRPPRGHVMNTKHVSYWDWQYRMVYNTPLMTDDLP